jgi:hypothetical protein
VLSGAPTWPAHPQTLAPPAAPAGESSSGGFDWGSAAVGAGSAIVLSALTLAIAATFVRRRRRARAPSLAR